MSYINYSIICEATCNAWYVRKHTRTGILEAYYVAYICMSRVRMYVYPGNVSSATVYKGVNIKL